MLRRCNTLNGGFKCIVMYKENENGNDIPGEKKYREILRDSFAPACLPARLETPSFCSGGGGLFFESGFSDCKILSNFVSYHIGSDRIGEV